MTITPATRALVEERIEHTLRLLNHSAVSAHVVLTRERSRIHAEVTVHARRERFLRGEATGSSVELALNAASAKIDRQARTLKGKLEQRKRRAGGGDGAAGESVPSNLAPAPRRPRIVRARRYAVKPMSVEDAVAEIAGGQESFIVFRNSATDAITVLYRRPSGDFGLIEPDV